MALASLGACLLAAPFGAGRTHRDGGPRDSSKAAETIFLGAFSMTYRINRLELEPATNTEDVKRLDRVAKPDREFMEGVLKTTSIPERPHPWGTYIARESDGTIVGACCFKRTPEGREVEIAYATLPSREGQGWGRNMVLSLVEMCRERGVVDRVVAHTLPTENASTSILRKCGFCIEGEMIDPEDGVVWRWILNIGPLRQRE